MGSKSFEKRLAPPVDRRRIHYTPPPGDGRFHVWRGPLRISPPSESFVHGSRRFITASALKWDGLRTAGIVLMRLWRRRRAFTMRRERASERCGDVLAGRRLTATSHAREKTVASHRPHRVYPGRSPAINHRLRSASTRQMKPRAYLITVWWAVSRPTLKRTRQPWIQNRNSNL